MIIVQGKLHMTSWQAGLKDKKTLFHVSDTGFINIDIAMDYLDHLIKHTTSGVLTAKEARQVQPLQKQVTIQEKE